MLALMGVCFAVCWLLRFTCDNLRVTIRFPVTGKQVSLILAGHCWQVKLKILCKGFLLYIFSERDLS